MPALQPSPDQPPAAAAGLLPVLPAQPGFFGKLPVRADFVTRGLPPGFTDPWHAWLVRGLAAARDTLGARFEPAYMAAPVWRFLLPVGACGPEAVAGVLLPSVDAADRLFPLTIAAVTMAPAAALRETEDWFGALEDAGREALADGLEFEAWLGQVAALPAPPGLSIAPPDQVPAPEAGVTFWSDGSPYVAAAARVLPALPEGAEFARLLADPAPAQEVRP